MSFRRLRLTSPTWLVGPAGAAVDEQLAFVYTIVPSASGRRVQVLGAIRRLKARVATWLVRHAVRPRVGDVGRVARADPATLRAVDRDAHVVGEGLGSGGGAGGGEVRGDRGVPLRRS